MLVRMTIIKKVRNRGAGEDLEKMKSSYTVGENINWCSYYEKQYGDFSKN